MTAIDLDALSPQRRELAERILSLTHDMLAYAEKAEWEEMIAIEAMRHPLVEAFFATPATAAEKGSVAAFIGRLQAEDGKTMALAAAGKQHIADQLRGLNQGQQAARAYASAGRKRPFF